MTSSEPLIVPPPVRLYPPPKTTAIPRPQPIRIQQVNQSPTGSLIYPKSPSTINQHWTSFGRFENRTFTHDFCHSDHLAIKASGRSYGGSIFKIKETINFGNNRLGIKDNIRILFPVNHYVPQTFQLRFTESDTRFHVDNGIIDFFGHNVNFYGSVGFAHDWKKWNFKVGGAIINRGIELNSRLKFSNEAFNWYHKLLFKRNHLRVGFIGALDLTNRELIKKDFLIGYYNNGLDLSLKLEDEFSKRPFDPTQPRQWYNTHILTATYHHTVRTKYGLQMTHHPSTKQVVTSGLLQYIFDKNKIKAKLDSTGNFAFVVKSILNDFVCVKVGAEFSFKDKEKKKLGVELMFNI